MADEQKKKKEPYGLDVDANEDSDDMSRDDSSHERHVDELDVCPNCGAPMRGSDTLLCLRCGFDLKTMSVKKTATTVASSEDEDEAEEHATPLVEPNFTDPWLPISLAVVSGLGLVVAYLAGYRGVFPRAETVSHLQDMSVIPWSFRFAGLFKLLILSIVWSGCALGALFFLANLIGDRLGDLKIAALRMLGIVFTIKLATLIDLSSMPLEYTTEGTIQILAFLGLSMAMFGLVIRDALTLLAAAVIACVLLWLSAYVIVWVTG